MEVFLKIPVIIIIRFCENNVLGPILINFGGWRSGSLYISRLPLIKAKNLQEHDLSYNKIVHLFHLTCFSVSWVNNKEVTERGGRGPHSILFRMSIVVFTDIVTKLLTPGFC